MSMMLTRGRIMVMMVVLKAKEDAREEIEALKIMASRSSKVFRVNSGAPVHGEP